MILALTAALVLQASPSPAEAAAYARIDQIGAFAVSAGWCERIGWTVADDLGDQLQERAAAEAAAQGVSRSRADEWALEAVNRRLSFMRAELDGAVEAVGTGTEKRDLTRLFESAEQRCSEFAADPVSAGLISSDGVEQRAALRQAALDSLLEPLGQASWQDPQIFAQAELLYALGACKPVIPQTRHDQLWERFMPDPTSDGREERYLAGQYVEGLQSAAGLGLDSTQCNRVLRSRVVAVGE